MAKQAQSYQIEKDTRPEQQEPWKANLSFQKLKIGIRQVHNIKVQVKVCFKHSNKYMDQKQTANKIVFVTAKKTKQNFWK